MITMSRRRFVATGVGCLASSAAASAVLPAIDHLDIGIGTYSYHALPVDDMIAQLRALNIRKIEMSRGEYMLLSHPADQIFRELRVKLDRAGIDCVSYYAATFATDQDVEDAIRFARLLGSTNITGDAPGPLLSRIDSRLTAEGLTFGLHNHFFKYKFAYESPEDVLNALAPLSTTMGATADTGHFASCGYDPAVAVHKLAPRLRMVHLKDVQAAGGEVNVLLGQGIAKIPQVMEELHRQKFRGLVAVEYEKEGPVDEDLRKEVAYARSLA
jgi:sugar phosphate isomerase/epimerase